MVRVRLSRGGGKKGLIIILLLSIKSREEMESVLKELAAMIQI